MYYCLSIYGEEMYIPMTAEEIRVANRSGWVVFRTLAELNEFKEIIGFDQ